MRVEHSPSTYAPRQPSQSGGRPATAAGAPAFADLLARAGSDIQLSRHAQKRIDRRDLDLDAGRLQRLENAITQAASKGARNSVVMIDELAVVVDVPGRTVVTAMPGASSAPRVFTNIDSVVIA